MNSNHRRVLSCLLSLLCLFLSDSTPCLSQLQVQTLYYAVPVPALTPGLLRYNVKFNQCYNRIWKGIFGIRDLNKIRSGIRENAKYLDGKRDLTVTGKRDSPKFGHGVRDFFCPSVGNSGSRTFKRQMRSRTGERSPGYEKE